MDRWIASLSDDPEVEEARAAEIDRRIAEIDVGRVRLLPATEVIARARDAIM